MRRYAVVGLGLCLGLAVVPACEKDAATQSATQPGEQAWGTPVNGLQAGLDFLGFFVGEFKAFAKLRFRLRNAGDKPVRVLRLSARAHYWGENLPIEVKVGSEVLKYRGPVLEPPLPPGPESYVYLAPGGIDSVDVEMNPAHWGAQDLSKATAAFVFTNRNEKEDLGPRWPVITGLWIGTARSVPISLAS